MWSSVLLYKVPDVEVTACVLLSTKAIYFLLDDNVIHSSEHHLGKKINHFLVSHSVNRIDKDVWN